ncbi:hypothetical protein L7F22_038722 [Adiantum nelumboides]|nr:hypothetical protein [Adiantum nelumboides]
MGIFEPYRALGYITDNIPFVVQQRGLENFVTVSVGKTFQIFNCAKLSLVFVAPQLEKRIRALACWRDYTYAASGTSIFVFRRAQQVAQWSAHQNKIVHIIALGDHILSIDSEGWIFVWETTNLEKEAAPLRTICVEEPILPTCLMHPDTYLNKVIVGTEEGSLFLWNISTGKLLYKFEGWGSPIRCCVSSPALDVVGIGCADGKIHIHNLRFDETVVTFSHTTRGSVTALSFRTGLRGVPDSLCEGLQVGWPSQPRPSVFQPPSPGVGEPRHLPKHAFRSASGTSSSEISPSSRLQEGFAHSSRGQGEREREVVDGAMAVGQQGRGKQEGGMAGMAARGEWVLRLWDDAGGQ